MELQPPLSPFLSLHCTVHSERPSNARRVALTHSHHSLTHSLTHSFNRLLPDYDAARSDETELGLRAGGVAHLGAGGRDVGHGECGPLSHSLTQSLTHSLTQSLTHTLSLLYAVTATHSATHSLTHSLTHSPTHLLIACVQLSQLADRVPEGYNISAYLILSLTLGNLIPLLSNSRLKTSSISSIRKTIGCILVVGISCGVRVQEEEE